MLSAKVTGTVQLANYVTQILSFFNLMCHKSVAHTDIYQYLHFHPDYRVHFIFQHVNDFILPL